MTGTVVRFAKKEWAIGFERLSERGGVLGAMEHGYQRGKIQNECLHSEHKKHDGSLPIVGVSTYLKEGSQGFGPVELSRATEHAVPNLAAGEYCALIQIIGSPTAQWETNSRNTGASVTSTRRRSRPGARGAVAAPGVS